MKKIAGKISINRWWQGSDKSGVTIAIQDGNSGVNICEVQMSVEEFAQTLFGQSYNDCEVELWDAYNTAGKFPIHKTIWAEGGLYKDDRDFLAREAAKQHEVDGWKYSGNQLGNHHYAQRDFSVNITTYPVYLIKYVDTLKEKEEYEENEKCKNSPATVNSPKKRRTRTRSS